MACELDVELVVAEPDDKGALKLRRVHTLPLTEKHGQQERYAADIKSRIPGRYKYSLRILPKHAELPHRQDFAYVRWVALS